MLTTITYDCVKIMVDGSYTEKTVQKEGFVKPIDMTVVSEWKKRVCIVFYNMHFMHIKEFLEVEA